MKLGNIKICIAIATLLCSTITQAGSLYLPVNVSPEIETRIERLFVLANMAIIKRPIPVKQVHLAMERVAKSDPALVNSIRNYLQRYTVSAAITHVNISASANEGVEHALANQRGYSTESGYQGSYSAFWILNDYVAINLGGHIGERADYVKDEFAEGSFISLGWDAMQLDIGYRPHWLSPFQESGMLLTTQASALPGITISNSTPFKFLGMSYEIFAAQMSESDSVLSQARDERLTGKPKLLGVHLSFAPIDGFAIGFNRMLQYGGADRDDSPQDIFNAFLNVKENDNIGREGRDFGNQLSSVNTRYTFIGDFPVSVYMEYAGEDTSLSSDVHLGNSALMLGVHLPKLAPNVDFTYEYAQWQNGWYVNSNYGDGLTHYQSLLGHWGGTNRNFENAVGATAQLIKATWDIQAGSSLSAKIRMLENEPSAVNYELAQEIEIEYAQAVGAFIMGANLINGSDAFGDTYTRLSGFIRW